MAFECVDASFLSCDSSQRVLHHGVFGLCTECAAQLLELCNSETAVFGQDDCVRSFEEFLQLGYCSDLFLSRHGSSFFRFL
ncbi:Uncharacterised protein [Mycobacterium tuberculosis]|nr:Uncharacterised protein [Mycobacterium tuberculosis]